MRLRTWALVLLAAGLGGTLLLQTCGSDEELDRLRAERQAALGRAEAYSDTLQAVRAARDSLEDAALPRIAELEEERARAEDRAEAAEARARAIGEGLRRELPPWAQTWLDSLTTEWQAAVDQATLRATLAEQQVQETRALWLSEKRYSASLERQLALERSARHAADALAAELERRLHPSLLVRVLGELPAIGGSLAAGLAFGDDGVETLGIAGLSYGGHLLGR